MFDWLPKLTTLKRRTGGYSNKLRNSRYHAAFQKYILTFFKTNSLSFHSCRNKTSQSIRSILRELKFSVAPSVDIRYLSVTKHFVYHS